MTKAGIILVLGSPNGADGSLYSVALARCEQAMALWHDNPDWDILLTGGYGNHFNTTPKPHAQYLRDHLVSHGVPSEKILAFAESRNTIEDAALSKSIVASHGAPVAVIITSDYHVARARFVFTRDFSEIPVSLLFIGTPTDKDHCEFDLASQVEHERNALKKLKADQEAQQDAAHIFLKPRAASENGER